MGSIALSNCHPKITVLSQRQAGGGVTSFVCSGWGGGEGLQAAKSRPFLCSKSSAAGSADPRGAPASSSNTREGTHQKGAAGGRNEEKYLVFYHVHSGHVSPIRCCCPVNMCFAPRK